MGSGSYSSADWASYSRSAASKSVDELYKSNYMDNSLDPKNIKFRESCDSSEHPMSTPIIIDIDVTGSMGMIAEIIAKKSLGILFQEILDRKPVTDPQLMFMANGDVRYDHAPLQVSQFESDNRIVEQLTKIYIEHGGGGNSSESYDLPWYFAAKKTRIDSYDKRGKKGYLFTIGDEESPYGLERDHIKNFIGDTIQADLSPEELLKMAEQKYNVFHIVVEEGDYCNRARDKVMNSWTKLLGQRAIPMADHTKLAEIIVSTIQITEGADKDKVISSWNGDTSVVVSKAISGLSTRTDTSSAIVTL